MTTFSAEVVVRRRRFSNPETGFAVLDGERDGDEIVLVGPLAHLEERERVAVEGVWDDDQRFGLQVKVRDARPLAPSGEAALAAYLRRVKHVGRARGRRGCSSATARTCSRRSTRDPRARVPRRSG